MYLFDRASIVTVEGLAEQEALSEVQVRMREFHGGQCGYCTPGMVCSLSGLMESRAQKNSVITEKKARNHLTGNLCRCTGYEPILQAATHMDASALVPLAERYCPAEYLKTFSTLNADEIILTGTDKKVYAPARLQEALQIKARHPDVRLVSGATEMGQGVNTKIQQIVAHALGLPAEDVKVMATSTEKITTHRPRQLPAVLISTVRPP